MFLPLQRLRKEGRQLFRYCFFFLPLTYHVHISLELPALSDLFLFFLFNGVFSGHLALEPDRCVSLFRIRTLRFLRAATFSHFGGALGPGHTAAGFSIMFGRGRSGRDRKNLQRGHTTFSVCRRSALAAAAACT